VKTLVLGVAAACSYTVRMFLKRTQRIKDGKTHHYWSVVENRRLINGKVMQRQVLYLGEINDSQKLAWRKSIEVFDEGTRRQVALFADDALPADYARAIGVRLSEMQLKRPRQWGACWLSCVLWQQLGMDEFWSARLPASRKGTRWLQVLQTLVAVSADRSWLGVASAPALVHIERDGRSAGRGFCAGRQRYAVSLPGQAAGGVPPSDTRQFSFVTQLCSLSADDFGDELGQECQAPPERWRLASQQHGRIWTATEQGAVYSFSSPVSMRRSIMLGASISASVRASAWVRNVVELGSRHTMLSSLEISAVARNSRGATSTTDASKENPLYVSGIEISLSFSVAADGPSSAHQGSLGRRWSF
jgi:hypothetical protein